MSNDLRFRATMDDQVSGTLGKIRDRFDQLGKSKGAQTLLQGIGIGAGITAFGLLDSAVSETVDLFKQSITSAIDAEDSYRRMGTALKANVAGWDGNTRAVSDQIDKIEEWSAFTKKDLRNSFTLLVGATHDVGKAFDIQRTAMDLARFKGVDLATATEALTRVEGGSYRILKSLGIQLPATATQFEALAAVEKVAAGQAEDFGKSHAGALDRIQNTWNDAIANIGGGAVKVSDNLGGLGDAAAFIASPLGNAQDALSGLADAIHGFEGTLPPVQANVLALGRDFDHDLSRAMDDATAAFKPLNAQATIAWRAFGKLADNVDNAAKAIDDSFNKQIDPIHIKALNDELAKAKGHLHDLERIKHPTLDQRIDIDNTREQILGFQKDILTTGLDIAKLGQKPPKFLLDYLDVLAKKTDAAGLAAKALLAQLNDLAKVHPGWAQMFTGAKGKQGQHAAGGFAPTGELAMFGEHGPELGIPGVGGYDILTAGQTAGLFGGRGGGTTVNLTVNSYFPPTPQQVREIVGHLHREIDRVGYYELSRASPSGIRK